MAYEALYTRVRPKTLAQLIGQEHITTPLTRAISKDRLSHAYLLVGTRGTGKTSTARLLAKALNCEKVLEAQKSNRPLNATEIPCGKCPSCLSINSSPDNIEFDAASNRSVEDVQRLLSTASLAPLQSRVKTFIIDEVHMLSFEAVNSILKLIEEPPSQVAFFLATTEFNKVPQTIRSRCQILNFHLIPNELIVKYLQKLSKSLEVEIEPDAARKIARMAAGSMRDAVTYFDQCYAMADKNISLTDVEKTLGLVSNADLDEIISALKSQNRTALGSALIRAFRSGLSSISIAEALIGRLRDIEFGFLKRRDDSELHLLENFAAEIRKVIVEMQYSGVPDVIFEMALMKIAAPKVAVQSQASQTNAQKNSAQSENLDYIKKIYFELIAKIPDTNKNMRALLKSAAIVSFVDNILTLNFASQSMADIFNDSRQAKFEEYFSQLIGRKIKVIKVIGGNVNQNLDDIGEHEKRNIKAAMNVFQTENFSQANEDNF
ncbi:MAG: DNA polymerase III subunit gamma/tau [Selenomonadaceae bacterium]|nr:DNA polymerase III subunit gamma/tau [Selenomonadaceae bacterium]